ncbi:GntR family transcriptional regulator [Alkalicoccobacillus porphyridii]|uniref:GntR family transcriptional regulator n=1 Tax=Alkalicoccobacillus porphyridii TaxID=2597270 RepID=A0A554A3I4_9BACI|nr:GntR family transcriptional regulator [Alkalicoccobacillus porphyridii]TSB48251.1 GntR family transcriptional regulator [Alkalicoccobacillus porphyridii]
MTQSFDEGQPIFLQIARRIEDDIINGATKEGEQVPSTNQFAKHYQINPATAAKGINLLVEQEILFKKRGVGMFVAEGARDLLVKQRQIEFYQRYIVPLLQEAEYLQLSKDQIKKMIDEGGTI